MCRTLTWTYFSLLLLCLVGLGCGAADQAAMHVAEDEGQGAAPSTEGAPSADTPTPEPRLQPAADPLKEGVGSVEEIAAPMQPSAAAPEAAETRTLAPMAPTTSPRTRMSTAMESSRLSTAEELGPREEVTAAPQPTMRIMSQPDVRRSAPNVEPIEEMVTDPPPTDETADDPPAAAPAPIAENRGDYEVVTVFYGTDRNSTVTSGTPARPHLTWFYASGVAALLCGLFATATVYGSRRKTFGSLAILTFSASTVMALMGTIAWLQSDGALAGPKVAYGHDRGEFVMGTCEVSIPSNHEVAVLEAPSVYKLDFVEDPSKHVALLEIQEEDPDEFFAGLRTRVDGSLRKEAFVFVHGFNVTFKDAARRTAQLAYDLKFQGAPIFYSWPSQGGFFQYAIDETNVVWTVPHLQEFLKQIALQSGAESVHLIAHSMGNRALTSALRELSLELGDQPPMFHEVVLTAPDIDAEVFRRDLAPAIVKTARRVTLYASSNDEALVLSKQFHGYPRAGDTGDDLVVIPGIETIDVSAVDTSLLGHTYYGDNATVIADMIDLVRESKSARERTWLEMTKFDELNELFYWVFRPDLAHSGTASGDGPARY